jgi:adenylate kinase family enzyme
MQTASTRQLIVFTGLPACGKSTLADALAIGMGVPAFAGDWLMGGLKPAQGVLAELDRAAYLDTYYSLLESLIVRQFLVKQSAIVDAMIDDRVAARWHTLVEGHGADFLVVECICSDVAVHRGRVEGRVRAIPGWHEVVWAHVQRMREEFPRLTWPCLVIDAVDSVETNLSDVRTYVSGRCKEG